MGAAAFYPPSVSSHGGPIVPTLRASVLANCTSGGVREEGEKRERKVKKKERKAGMRGEEKEETGWHGKGRGKRQPPE